MYGVDDKLLQHLDWLEDHPDTYRRIPTQCIMLQNQSLLDCEVYMVFDFDPKLLTLPILSSYDSSLDEGSKYRAKTERDNDFKLRHEIKQPKED